MAWHTLGTARTALHITGRRFVDDTARDARNISASLRVFVLTVVVSVLMGVAGWAFLLSLRTVTSIREANLWLFALLPLVNVTTVWLYHNHGLRASRGNNLVIDSTLTGTHIHARMGLLTFVCSTATHLAGGSAGREGAAVQIGGTIASNVSALFKVRDHDRRDLMMAGISAAFGAAFGTPLAGAFFGMEMCFVGKLDYSAGLYCLTGSFIGNAVSRMLGSEFAFQTIPVVPDLSLATLALVILAGVAFGAMARLFTLTIRTVKRLYGRLFPNYLARAAASGAMLALLFIGFGLYRYGGLSEWLPGAAFHGQTTLADAFLKLALTALTVGVGFQGGEVTPLFGIGAALGGWIGTITLGDPGFMAALGMVAMFGSALNVPITTIMLGIDMFGSGAGAYFVIVSFISYLVAGHRALYPAQRIVTPKRRSLKQDVGLTVADVIERHGDPLEELIEGISAASEAAAGPVENGDGETDGVPDRATAETATSSEAAGDPSTTAPTDNPSPTKHDN